MRYDITPLHLSLSHTHTHIYSLSFSLTLSPFDTFTPLLPLQYVSLVTKVASWTDPPQCLGQTEWKRVRNFRGWVRGLKGKHTEERRRQGERERVRRKGGKGEKRVRGETKPQQASLVWGFLAYWRVRTTLVARWVFPPLIEYLHLCVFS